jgi:hypothetical protein
MCRYIGQFIHFPFYLKFQFLKACVSQVISPDSTFYCGHSFHFRVDESGSEGKRVMKYLSAAILCSMG